MKVMTQSRIIQASSRDCDSACSLHWHIYVHVLAVSSFFRAASVYSVYLPLSPIHFLLFHTHYEVSQALDRSAASLTIALFLVD